MHIFAFFIHNFLYNGKPVHAFVSPHAHLISKQCLDGGGLARTCLSDEQHNIFFGDLLSCLSGILDESNQVQHINT